MKAKSHLEVKTVLVLSPPRVGIGIVLYKHFQTIWTMQIFLKSGLNFLSKQEQFCFPSILLLSFHKIVKGRRTGCKNIVLSFNGRMAIVKWEILYLYI